MLTFADRKLVLILQALQLLDAALVWLGFWLASILRDPIRELFGMVPMSGRLMLADMSWVLYIAVPFMPLVLEYFGFYRQVPQKSGSKAMQQIAMALAVIGLVLGLISVFSRLQDASRLVIGLAVPLVAILLLMRDRFTQWRARAAGFESRS